MTILAFETTANVASVALMEDGQVTFQCEAPDRKRHSETLLPLTEELLLSAGKTLLDVDAFAVDVGPGSFTGVRIGVSTVNALAFALQKSVIGVDSLTVLAEQSGIAEGNIAVLIDAGGGRAYAACFEKGRCTCAPAAVDLAAFLSELPKDAAVISGCMPTARGLCMAAAKRRQSASARALPIYLQPSQAERVYDKKHAEERV